MGKLIVLDGLDGCGKSTQAPEVEKALSARGEKVITISYPDYKSLSSGPVRMYLNGELAADPDEINAYAASSFYAVDRYASYKKNWEKAYNGGAAILATRYTTSNAIHQMSKLPENKWDGYLEWLEDFEYQKLGLPKPDTVIFLDMDRGVADRLIEARYNGDETKKDIHEADIEYMARCRKSALYAAKKLNWRVVRCSDGEQPYPIEKITENILGILIGKK